MLASDWRGDARAFAVVDFASWPRDQPIAPRPPIPVLGCGPRDHPQAAGADTLIESPVQLDLLTQKINAAPKAAATLAHLLRATDGVALEQALTLESFALATLQAGGEHAAWRARRGRVRESPPGRLDLTRRGDVLDLLMVRPDAHNAIDRPMRDALFDAFTLAALDPSIARVRLRGMGRAFCIGADLSEFGATLDPSDAHAIRMRTLPARPLLRRALPFEVHVQGACIGAGLELAAFATHLSASADAWFQLPEVSMGILPGFGGCVSIPRRIGRHRAALLMLSGKRINAETALNWGLIDALMD